MFDQEFDPRKFAQIVQGLPLMMESEHFVVRYGLRNPRKGRGLGPSGVGDEGLIRWYLSAMERLFRTMTNPPWSRVIPQWSASGKLPVYVCNLDQVVRGGDPFTAFDRNGAPFIALSCRSSEPLTSSAMQRAAAEAVHEAVHAFNSEKRPFHRTAYLWWAWLDEALATFMESQVLPGNQDYFRFLSNWIDLPGVALNDWQAAYHGCLFLGYLTEAVDCSFPNRIWTEASSKERPLQTIHRLASEIGLAFADTQQPDLFASGYAMSAYFLRHHNCGCFAELYSRFGDRAVVESFDLHPGFSGIAQESLPHLASHYYRCFVSRHVHRVHFTLRARSQGSQLPFKAEAAVVQPDLSCGSRLTLGSSHGCDEQGRIVVKGELAGLSELDFHHIVLVVNNCSYRDMDLPSYNGLPPCEPYELQILAE